MREQESDLSKNEGIQGKLTFTLPNKKDKDQKEVHVQGKIGPGLAVKICQNMNYRQGTVITSQSSKIDMVPVFQIKPNSREHRPFCLKTFAEIVNGQEFSSERIEKINHQCVKNDNKDLFQIRCTKAIDVRYSLTAQNAP